VPDPIEDAEGSAEQPGPRPTVADPRADLVEPVRTGLDLVGSGGQGPSQRPFQVVALG
jgi:hypothetical protein